MTDNSSGDSRRSFLKKGTLAATALAVGAGASATTATAQEDDDQEDGEGEVVVNGQDYYPGADFEVLAEFESGTRDNIMESENFEGEFENVGDWDAYAVNFDVGTGGVLGYFFVDEDEAQISAGDTGSMTGTASFRNAEANLLDAEVTTEAAEEEPEEEEEEEPEEEPEEEEEEEPEEEEEEEPEEEPPEDEPPEEEPPEDEPPEEEPPEDEPPEEEEDDDGGIFG